MLASEPLGNEDFNRFANKVGPFVAKEPFGLRVDENDVFVAVDDDNGIGSGFKEITEPVLGALVCPDVARDRRSADDRAFAVANGRLGERDRDEAPVLFHAAAFVILDPLSLSNPLQDRRVLIPVILGDEGGERLPHDLLRGVPVESLRGPIPARHDVIEVAADDCVVGRIDDGCEQGELARAVGS